MTDSVAGTAPAGDSPLEMALEVLAAGHDLDEALAEAAFREVIGGEASQVSIAALLVGLRAKGETAIEVAGAARALRASMRRVSHANPEQLVDTCGTGGGAVTTINVSTAAAFVVAAAGIPVAKHGNRSYSSRSGSADVLEALQVAIDHTPTAAAETLAEHGIVFLFAPIYHPAMRHVAAVRRELATPTIMNLLGPLANPAGATRQVIGVADRDRAPVVAAALARLRAVHALVVHAEVGMDEVAPVGATMVWEVRDGAVKEWTLDPRTHGLATATLDGLEGGEPADNAARLLALFDRPAHAPPALRSAVVLNAAAAIHIAGRTDTLEAAVGMAADALDSGRTRARLEALRRIRQTPDPAT